ncbi:MAG: hypothetical protein NWF04_10580 [Candidatus Bathyarchaeota archaeon]|nr:hypothetical protein [Candidatus Bathyarchaeota archaeon]
MAKPEPKEFQAQLVYLTPILASLIITIFCALLLQNPSSQAVAVPVTPIPQNTPAGPYLNAVYLFALMAVGASGVYLLIKYRSRNVLNLLMGVAVTLAFLLLGFIYTVSVLAGAQYSTVVGAVVAVVVAVLGDLAVFRLGGKTSDFVIVVLGGALGAFFGAFLSISTVLLLLGVLSIYDTLAVYYGPIGKIASSGLEQIKGVSFAFKDIQMGLGDLVFYSLLAGSMLIRFGWIPCALSVAGIVVGSYLTFWMLERHGMFPGLPFPLTLGITLGLLGSIF